METTKRKYLSNFNGSYKGIHFNRGRVVSLTPEDAEALGGRVTPVTGEVETPKTEAVDKALKDMTREELNEKALSLGLSKEIVEGIGKKKELIEIIEEELADLAAENAEGGTTA